MNDDALAFVGTAFHTPERGALDILEDAAVIVDPDGTISRIGNETDPDLSPMLATFEATGRLHRLGRGQFLIPGLIDLHIHAPQWPQLGKALHLPLEDWLQANTFPLEARYADLAFARDVYGRMVSALLANGTTTALYFATIHHEASLALAELCLEKGQRGFVGKVAMDDPAQCPDYYRDASAEASIAGTRRFIEAVRGLSGNGAGFVRPVVTPRFIPSCTDAALEGLGAVAHVCGCHVQTHCSESDWEHGYIYERFGLSDTAALRRFGLLTRHTVLAHSNFIGEADRDLIRAAGAGIAHCPLSNAYFSNAVFPLRAALEKGLRVGLGTDISGGHSPSIFDSCRSAVQVSRMLEEGVDPALPPGRRGTGQRRIDFLEAFWLATMGGADVLDIKAGCFHEGHVFDALVIDTEAADGTIDIERGLDGLADVFQKIVYTASRASIAETWVGGRCVHRRG